MQEKVAFRRLINQRLTFKACLVPKKRKEKEIKSGQASRW